MTWRSGNTCESCNATEWSTTSSEECTMSDDAKIHRRKSDNWFPWIGRCPPELNRLTIVD